MFHFIAVPKIVPIMRSRRDDGSRVLIVASRNPGNEANIDWFLQNVWPRLQGTGAALDVVGTISGYFEGKPVPVACTFHGSVPSLVTYYGNCDVVALPIVTGAGVAIKTIEALLHERPICATPHAFRGLGHAVGSLFPRLDDAVAFAEDLRSLIEDPGAARRRLELCREAARALAPEKFDAAFDARHRALLAAACQKRRPDPLSPVAGKGLG
jgi:glycosyltransferase involved in cell wall biosynthesis